MVSWKPSFSTEHSASNIVVLQTEKGEALWEGVVGGSELGASGADSAEAADAFFSVEDEELAGKHLEGGVDWGEGGLGCARHVASPHHSKHRPTLRKPLLQRKPPLPLAPSNLRTSHHITLHDPTPLLPRDPKHINQTSRMRPREQCHHTRLQTSGTYKVTLSRDSAFCKDRVDRAFHHFERLNAGGDVAADGGGENRYDLKRSRACRLLLVGAETPGTLYNFCGFVAVLLDATAFPRVRGLEKKVLRNLQQLCRCSPVRRRLIDLPMGVVRHRLPMLLGAARGRLLLLLARLHLHLPWCRCMHRGRARTARWARDTWESTAPSGLPALRATHIAANAFHEGSIPKPRNLLWGGGGFGWRNETQIETENLCFHERICKTHH